MVWHILIMIPVKNLLNERFYCDGYENILLYTTPEDVISASASSKDYYVTKEKKSVKLYDCICRYVYWHTSQ